MTQCPKHLNPSSNSKVPRVNSNTFHLFTWLGLYAGYWSLMAREIPFSSIQMTIYESIKKYRNPDGAESSLLDHAINGSTAGFFASVLTTPIDVIKTQMMIDRS
jgi:solute carrier family 25 (mitochondrial S-adenosylmethionine transporter), member 26